ncbi:protein kinase domain-containing protein [Novosphingobium cyanobacteriorum]|uniref:Serine/threonine-protein kinase n=1 Tax=Novosphingobium cyanobacteriorum TaxID=3024215 RepID=A0ABT6CMT7_9SPHN|nr:serine/threonine-protein kinase [Novosphingobium cyanobacteriorum]MDF8335172.1 serine/threonine-protein kinase [Novosphingobium cyanobacteriorum]
MSETPRLAPDPAIERRVLALMERLLAHPGNQRFRKRLLKNESGAVLVRIAALERAVAHVAAMPTELPPGTNEAELPPPKRFGPFAFVRRIGAGGMGEVWEARRDDGLFDQRVAIKLIQPRLQVRAAEAFGAERRILARLEHPGIARLIDGGKTDDGRQCLVMEFVDGQPIDEPLVGSDGVGLDLSERLRRFADAAQAVHHAHSQLVAHGDLKPSNILVDRKGRVRLLDFGIARLLKGDQDALVLAGAVTSAFASPARLAGGLPSIADDLFALGKILARIAEDEADVDIAAIAAKASATDPALRYDGVPALLADLVRREQHLPLAARGNDWRYRARLLVRRRWPALVAAAALTAMLVVAGTGFVSAEREKAEAGARFDDARATSRYLLYTLYDQLERQPGSLGLRREVAQTAQSTLNRLAESKWAGPQVRIEAAEGLLRLAQVQGSPLGANLGQPARARVNIDTALRLLEQAGEPRALLARARLDSAWLAELVEENTPRARADAALAQKAFDPTDPATTQLRASHDLLVSIMAQWDKDYPKALAAALAVERELAGDASLSALILKARAAEARGDVIWYGGNGAGSVPAYRQSVALLEDAVRRFPASMHALRRLGHARWALASALADSGAVTEGLDEIARSSADLRRVVVFDPADDDALRHLHISENARGGILVLAGRVDEGLQLLNATAAERRAIWQANPGEARRMRDYAVELKPLADLQLQTGRIAAACTNYAEARRLFELVDKAGRLSAQDRIDQLGNILKSQNKFCR